MLAAEKTSLSAELHARRLDIKEKDMNNLTVFLDGISTQSALLAGFAFAGLGGVDDRHIVWKAMLHIFTAVALGAHLYVLCVGQLTTIFGPTWALTDPPEASSGLSKTCDGSARWCSKCSSLVSSLSIL